jgi:hypothetical protein
MGSGKRLRYSIRKHGLENHTKEILEFLNDRDSLAKREAEIVNEQFLQDPLCMNLQLGGGGGFGNNEHETKFREGQLLYIKRYFENPNNVKLVVNQLNFKRIEKWKSGNIPESIGKGFKDKQHSKVTKQLMREKAQHRVGNKNSQYGTCWITNELENKKIRKGENIPNGWRLGRK